MYTPQEIKNNIKTVAKSKSIKTGAMLNELGYNKNALSTMESGHMPELMKICEIADYLDCSIDALLGREQKNNAPNDVRSAIIARVKALPDDRLDRLLGYLEALAAE